MKSPSSKPKRLPDVQPAPAHPEDAQRLAQWVHEWELDRVLSGGVRADSEAPEHSGASGRRIPCLPGQVRLLRPTHAPTRNRLFYVAILDSPREGTVVTAPFSRFSVPAVPGEMSTGFPAAPLRTLCCWNAVELPEDRLDGSWLITTLTRSDLQIARFLSDVHGDHVEDAPTPDRSDRIGPPLCHPCDPRWQYLEEERDAFRLALRVRPDSSTLQYPFPSAENVPRAAEHSKIYPDPKST